MDIQLFFDFFQQIEPVLTIPVHFIDENDDRRITHAAYFHQPARLLFHPVHAVDHQDNAVHRRQGAVGIFRKVFVTGSIQQVDQHVLVLKAHDRSGHRDTALPLDLHKVAGRVLLDLIAFYGTGRLDGAAKQQEFLGQGRLTGIGVGYDGKGLPPADL